MKIYKVTTTTQAEGLLPDESVRHFSEISEARPVQITGREYRKYGDIADGQEVWKEIYQEELDSVLGIGKTTVETKIEEVYVK